MAIRSIRKDDDPVLRKISREVTVFDERLKALAEDMIETMYEAEGVGLAAVQVGILRRVVVVDIYDETGPKVFVNPSFVEQSGEQCDPEGCLSLPGKSGFVTRPDHVKISYQDLEGNPQTFEADEFMARAICHELDHLDGVLFIDKIEEGLDVPTDQEVIEE